MRVMICTKCGRQVSTFNRYSYDDQGEQVVELIWACPCGTRNSRVVDTVKVAGTIL